MPAQAQPPIAVESRFADVNGTRLHYLAAGRGEPQGEPVYLLHGYTQTSHMWRPLIAELAKTRAVVAPDLRGIGQSARPTRGLRQEDDGAGCPGARRLARPPARAARRP